MANSSNSSHNAYQPLLCYHGVPARAATSRTERNPGRRFFSCSLHETDDCRYFEWFNPEASSHHNYWYIKVQQERELAIARNKLKLTECEDLKESLGKALAAVEDLKKCNEALKFKIKLLSLALALFIFVYVMN